MIRVLQLNKWCVAGRKSLEVRLCPFCVMRGSLAGIDSVLLKAAVKSMCPILYSCSLPLLLFSTLTLTLYLCFYSLPLPLLFSLLRAFYTSALRPLLYYIPLPTSGGLIYGLFYLSPKTYLSFSTTLYLFPY